MALFNYLNDTIPTTVIDCRRLDLENISLIRDSYHLKNFPFKLAVYPTSQNKLQIKGKQYHISLGTINERIINLVRNN